MSMVLPASTGVTLPADEEAQMWQPRVAMRRVSNLGFQEYQLAKRVPAERPRPRGVGMSTASRQRRLIIQAFREIGQPAPARYQNTLADGHTGPEWWEVEPPWQLLYKHFRGGHPRYENHRKALVWYASLYGLNGTQLPLFMRETWATKAEVAEAQAAGEMVKRSGFLRLPNDAQTLLAARPYTDAVVSIKSTRKQIREARLLDQQWRAIVFNGLYCGGRPGEYATLRLENVEEDRIVDWAQTKKRGKPRNVAIPEAQVFNGHPRLFPGLKWYITKIRPQFPNGRTTTGPVFLTPSGNGYTNDSMRDFIATGINRALGRHVGAHSLRRACATWRYQYGWSISRIARLLDDTEEAIERSYIDWDWISMTSGPLVGNSRTPTPSVPLLRSNGARAAAATKSEETASVRGFSSAKSSGPSRFYPTTPRRTGERDGENQPGSEEISLPPFYLTTSASHAGAAA